MSRGHKSGHHEEMSETLALLASAAVVDAMGNYAAIDAASPENTSAAPVAFIVAAIVLTPRTSGIFRVNASLQLVDSSSEGVTLSLFGAEQAVAGTPITLTGGSAAAQFGSGVVGATSLGEVSTVAGTPIAIVGDTGPLLLAHKEVTAVATDPTTVGTSGLFSYSTGGPTKLPFVLNETCVLYLAVTAAAGTVSAMNVDFTAQENPST
jgi:hypothetical protein